ncbi:SGNH/GDSL hydrolase family protein [Lacibacter sediminis]|uniref:G-D-S-L family lipolytic protein n=1 Tax=Lacibacter sediminis TaxID=2760713 RepID=A0A7G5XK07_9BACT|nr:GDSL-type esterase/lipase family protein [Lacibacter sediminis]QNA45810.1 G-D-S-L family lipolytic protein [Lacibacter sediminis]
MKKIILFALPIFMLMAFTRQDKVKVIFFGDSITQAGVNPGGYVKRIDSMARVQGKMNYDFIGAGIGGNKIYDLYLRMEDDVLSKNPNVVVLYIGVNDVWHKASSGTGTDADKFAKFYQAVINKIKAKNAKIILCTPAVIGEKTDGSNQQDGDLTEYSKIIRGLAQKNELPLVDLRKAFIDYNNKNNKENKDRGILTTDRVHLNAIGNQLVADEMWKAIQAL